MPPVYKAIGLDEISMSMSAATIDRALLATREKIDGQRRRRASV